MSRPDWWLGEATATSASVIVRATAVGDVVGSTAGQTVVVAADPAQRDGVVRLDFDLALGDIVSITEPGGGSAEATLRAMPASGGCITWGGCIDSSRSFPDQVLMRRNADVFVGLGDMPYAEGGTNRWGMTSVGCNDSLENAINPLNYSGQQRQVRRHLGIRLFGYSRPIYLVPDDHDIAINNAEFSEFAINNGLDFELVQPWEPDGRIQAQQIVTAGTQGLKHYYQGNPQNADSDVDPEAFYYRFECGDIEVFVLSCVNWGVGDNLMRVAANGSQLGPRQKQWLFDRLAASNKTFKLILSPKQTLFATDVNVDSWRGNWGVNDSYSQEWRDIAEYIHAGAGWAIPGGVAWGSSDWHSPGVFASFAGLHDATADHVCINSTLARDPDGIRSAGAFSPYTLWAVNDPDLVTPNSAQGTQWWGFGLAQVSGDQLELAYITKTDRVQWAGAVRAGENKLAESL